MRAMPPFITICGWCPDSVEQTAAARARGFEVSHGICQACAARVDAELAEREERLAERLRQAVDL